MQKYNKKRIKEILANELRHSYEVRGEDPNKHKKRINYKVRFMMKEIDRELTVEVDSYIFAMSEVERLKRMFAKE